MSSLTTRLDSTYFQTYLAKLPENAKAQKTFSYDPYVARLPKFFSLTNLFRTTFTLGLHLLAYPIAYIRDFWKAHQVTQNSSEARRKAINTLKQEVQNPLPIRALAIVLLTQERAPAIQERVALEQEERGRFDLAQTVREAEPTTLITFEDYETTADALDLTEGVDHFMNRISEDGTKTLFLEMANQRLPEQLRNEALFYIHTTYGFQYTFGEETIRDEIEPENQIITIRRTIKLELNGLEKGSVTITGRFDCRNQEGRHRITANLHREER